MHKRYLVLGAIILVLALALALHPLALAQAPLDSQPDSAGVAGVAVAAFSDSNPDPDAAPEVVIPEQFRPVSASSSPSAAPVPATQIYFTPQDENTSTTVLFLYNTSAASATVSFTGYRATGTVYTSQNVTVPAAGLVRICADAVDTISASWADVVVINMTTSTTYARLALPAGVKAEGFVVWNGETPYDPLQAVPTLPLRFSTDPATVYMPTIRGD